MFYTRYGKIAFILSYLFPPEASSHVVKHLKRFDYEISRKEYLKKSHLGKALSHQYIMNTSIHRELSTCSLQYIYSSVYKNENYRNLLKQLNNTFSNTLENTSQIFNYIHNSKRIIDFDTGYYMKNGRANNVYLVTSYNFHHFNDILHHKTRARDNVTFVVRDDNYYYHLKYRFWEFPQKIKNKQFKQSIKNIHNTRTTKKGFRRKY